MKNANNFLLKILVLSALFTGYTCKANDVKILSPEGYLSNEFISDFEKSSGLKITNTHYFNASTRDNLITNPENLSSFDVVITDEKSSVDIYSQNAKQGITPLSSVNEDFFSRYSVYTSSYFYGVAANKDKLSNISNWNDFFNLSPVEKGALQLDDEYDVVMLAAIRSSDKNKRKIENFNDITIAGRNFFRFTQKLSPYFGDPLIAQSMGKSIYLTNYSKYLKLKKIDAKLEFKLVGSSPIEKKMHAFITPKNSNSGRLFLSYINNNNKNITGSDAFLKENVDSLSREKSDNQLFLSERAIEMRINYVYERMINATFY